MYRCGYEVSGMILLQAYLYTYSLLRGVNYEVLPLRTYVLSPMMLSLLETFLELQLWNSFHCCCYIFLCLKYPEILALLRQALFLETARSHLETNQENRVGVPFP